MTEMPPYLAVKDEEESNEQADNDSSDIDDWDSPLCYDQPRHLEPIKGAERVEHSWRVKEKYKTHCVALVLCLNVGVDPPDVVKTQPCARLECWIDPNSLSQSKALESIGHALQAQYERWQPRARYKQSLDPTSDEVKKLCCSLRRNAKDERVLFHYNGHGVPKPTAQGEIWVFNRAYTQYIPLSMYDLQTWMGAPSLYVYDCSSAGLIVENFNHFAEQHDRDYEVALAAGTAAGGAEAGGQQPPVSYRNCIQLAACAAGQTLPMHPELPADLFTACLTTPVKMAMKWFVLRHARPDLHELIDKIPGQVTDRRTMLGELNWIFTAITDTIAWSSLPPELFQQLFRADLLTASLCRNFLLADRIMRSYNCTPVSAPALPSLASHALWAAWEQTLDLALAQLPALLDPTPPTLQYRHSPFFRDQLTAFQVWLDLGSACRPPPEQLPMVLQVLLSTLHRVRALEILCRFLALGAWAVRAVLNVGIFPYMLKLLQASAHELRASMVYIWAKIIAVDPSCQVDLVNAKGHKYFLSVLQDPAVDIAHRTLAAYVLACMVDGYAAGQEAALQANMISVCLEQLEGGSGGSEGLRLWALLGLGRLWRGHEAARGAAARDLAHEKLFPWLTAPQPEVRAAAAFALGTLAGASPQGPALPHQLGARLAARAHVDASPLVRAELLAALQWPVLAFEQHFIALYLQERGRRGDHRGDHRGGGDDHVDPGFDALQPSVQQPAHHRVPQLQLPAIGFGSVYMKVWEALTAMAREPHPSVAGMAGDIIDYIAGQVDGVGRDDRPTAGSGSGTTGSLPPSPNTRETTLHSNTHTLPGVRRGKSSSSSSGGTSGTSGTAGPNVGGTKRPLVSTQFAEWCAAQVARPDPAPAPDPEARPTLERHWRHQRNHQLRRHARKLLGARVPRLETQAFHSRCPLPPQVVLFHPYEQHAAVAFKDNFGVWDWGSGAKLCGGGWRRAWGRITALAYLHAGGAPLLAAGSAPGHVALYRLTVGVEPMLVTAWRALTARPARAAPPAAGLTAAPPAPPGALLRWSPARHSLCCGGAAPVLRLWDARAELLAHDVPTDSAAPVTALWRADQPHQLADQYLLSAGFADGAVRAWDERTPTARPLLTLTAHRAPVLTCARRVDRRLLVTACADGLLLYYDTRKLPQPLHQLTAPAPLAAVDVHPLADLLACGSVNQCISIYDLRGTPLNTIKFYEGFMGARIGPVSCLSFHPLRCAVGVGSRDLTLSVYVSESRR